MTDTDEGFAEALCSRLTDICNAAATRYEEHAEELSKLAAGSPNSTYGQMAQTFREQMVQARELAVGFSERSSSLAAIAEGAVSSRRTAEDIMSLVEAYGDARVAAREASPLASQSASDRMTKAKIAVQSAVEDLVARLNVPESDYEVGGFRP